MKVFLTGATGFIGSHILRQLLSEGYDVRVLARDAEHARALFHSLALKEPEIFQGDISDAELVRHAMSDCQAVIHAAGVDANGDALALESGNILGTENVLKLAAELNVEFVLHMSCLVTIFHTRAVDVVPDAAHAQWKSNWGKSLVAADQIARDLLQQGFPVATIYSGPVIGPDAPELTTEHQRLLAQLETGITLLTEEGADSGCQLTDVRDVAALACALLRQRKAGGHKIAGPYLTWSLLANVIDLVSGTTLKRESVEGVQHRRQGRIGFFANAEKKRDSDLHHDKAILQTRWPNIKSSPDLEGLGVYQRSAKQSLYDTLLFMRRRGDIKQGVCPTLDSQVAG